MFGRVLYWSKKQYGVLEVKDESNRVHRYFAHVRHVVLCEPETPYEGCYAIFEVLDQTPVRDGVLPIARNIEIYQSKSAGEQALLKGLPKRPAGITALIEGESAKEGLR